eukprot:CAMPEP_0179200250 /NCGR_PEP_ID=MMETSP0796-20121207/99658_1 /TAXON_ID=73915 /ORGANISM="Pyrodinium bahamense, Strain pbaha01" /LENGTH=129 /DNA_ID=CAMNT_0020904805 /DNA_START=122 /DNA_END=508 /DNA_ORIENTATION=+
MDLGPHNALPCNSPNSVCIRLAKPNSIVAASSLPTQCLGELMVVRKAHNMLGRVQPRCGRKPTAALRGRGGEGRAEGHEGRQCIRGGQLAASFGQGHVALAAAGERPAKCSPAAAQRRCLLAAPCPDLA